MNKQSKPPVIGAGYLYHCVPAFAELHARVEELGGHADIMEYLGAHYASDPEYIGEVSKSMGSPPSTLHSFELMIGSVDRPKQAVTDRLARMVELSDCRYIGEHIGIMGTTEQYTGTFIQPFGTDEQTQCFIDNLTGLDEVVGCPITIENQAQWFDQVGPRTVCEQVRDIAEGADVGILLSLSNFITAEKHHPMDREKELAVLPLDRVWQVHLPLGNAEELRQPDMARYRREQEWADRMLEELFAEPDFRPISVIFEVEDALTASHASAEQLKDALVRGRDLLGVAGNGGPQ